MSELRGIRDILDEADEAFGDPGGSGHQADPGCGHGDRVHLQVLSSESVGIIMSPCEIQVETWLRDRTQ